ncbi:TetR/AcrR family transcriptional regulator [Zestomonas thermotolerans]|uniref:TetR/AcrR family transcriptional regulator n=1 Tax=Zestomonas thermotolerans TaxID=157784 RepID=UPI0004B43B25|nr:TetR/AcrR family transcriptional regulator [Pseudomonas thermotolerans]
MQASDSKEKNVSDHRTRMAEKKRLLMRTKLLDAAMRVFAERSGGPPPVIDDVICEAKVSRGTFYRYFDSLDQVLVTLGQELNNQMTTEILPVYDVLSEPWQRFSVGFRVFLLRAVLDRKWAGFVTRADTWPHHALVAEYMSRDLQAGKAAGLFDYGRLDATTDFLLGASAHGIHALLQGVEAPHDYIDNSVCMAMTSLGCDRELSIRGVAFSVSYLQSWISGEMGAVRPVWALNPSSKEVREFLAHRTKLSD